MGFGKKWIKWMEATIFSSNMFVLVNGSTTNEFKVEKGLRQGDPLSPFLFVLVTEVLTALMRKAIAIGEFQAFKINGEEEISMLQFADDTILIGEGDLSNLWSMKAILRGFELMSGLRINFRKSKLYGALMCNLGDGRDIPFWYACWADPQPLMILFPDLFAIARDDAISVTDSGRPTATGWQWWTDCFL
ncbi:uncharacterized mitochondrial protein AtMg01250-like [Vicia villosa]|uniref:uncharacterized mitochondrial protein AtMg01250-like n=1 Tax=Vicia villosa TaxID=3911 RepID=UPI00273C2434|nr:uncharacterized mitochondrial protein AtMg01250-like [Vicia villosa]